MRAASLLAVLLTVDASCLADDIAAAQTLPDRPIFRRPIALAWAADDMLIVANRRSGTISLIDVGTRRVRGEAAVGERLAAMTPFPDGRRFAVVDDKRNELIVVRRVDPAGLKVLSRTPVGRDPFGLTISQDGSFAAVACRWSHNIDLVRFSDDDEPQIARSWTLPFPGREIAILPAGRIIVADAFGGGLAIIDPDAASSRITTLRVEGHNIRGLTLDDRGNRLLFTYQHLDQRLPSTAENIAGGRLISNHLREIPLDEFLHAADESLLGGNDVLLDETGRGAADPQSMTLRAAGQRLIALGGTQEIMLLEADGSARRRIGVGARPTAVEIDAASRTAFVADQLDDAISVVDFDAATTVARISLGIQPEAYPSDRGERLFFDARSSPAGFASCHSCHTDGHSAGLTADTLADGTYGTPKRIPTLLGTALTDHWAWNGAFRELREQVRQSFEATIHADVRSAVDHDDVAAFLHTLPFPQPPEPAPRDDGGDSNDVATWKRGQAIFSRQGCGRCHIPPLTYTSQPSFDVGLADERGLSKYNPPSLRGVGQNEAFFHDARVRRLPDVFRLEQHQLDDVLSPPDLDALVRYLRSL